MKLPFDVEVAEKFFNGIEVTPVRIKMYFQFALNIQAAPNWWYYDQAS